jgi:ABC-type taurine transport system substrate-binding protein
MRRIRRILAAVKDPGAAAPSGVMKAAHRAKALGAELVLYQAVPTPLAFAESASYLLEEPQCPMPWRRFSSGCNV